MHHTKLVPYSTTGDALQKFSKLPPKCIKIWLYVINKYVSNNSDRYLPILISQFVPASTLKDTRTINSRGGYCRFRLCKRYHITHTTNSYNSQNNGKKIKALCDLLWSLPLPGSFAETSRSSLSLPLASIRAEMMDNSDELITHNVVYNLFNLFVAGSVENSIQCKLPSGSCPCSIVWYSLCRTHK